MYFLPVPSRFVKNCLLSITHHWKASLSWPQITLSSNIHTVPCRCIVFNICACVALDMSLPFNMAFTLLSAQISSNSACNPDPCALYIQSNQENSLVKASYSQHSLFEGTWFILLFLDGHWLPVKRMVKSENRCHIILGRLFCNKVHCW